MTIELSAAIHGRVWGVLHTHGLVGAPELDDPRDLFDELVEAIDQALGIDPNSVKQEVQE